jgi:hypothetical protein
MSLYTSEGLPGAILTNSTIDFTDTGAINLGVDAHQRRSALNPLYNM